MKNISFRRTVSPPYRHRIATVLTLLLAFLFSIDLCTAQCNIERTGASMVVASGNNCAGLEIIIADVTFREEDAHAVSFCSPVELSFKLFIEGNPSAACLADTFTINILGKRIPLAGGDWDFISSEPSLNFTKTTLPSLTTFGVAGATVFQATFDLPDLTLPQYNGMYCEEFKVRLVTNVDADQANTSAELAAVSARYEPTAQFSDPVWNDPDFLIFSRDITHVAGDPNALPGTSTSFESLGITLPGQAVIQVHNDLEFSLSDHIFPSNTMFVLMEGARIIISGQEIEFLDDLMAGLNHTNAPPTVRACGKMWDAIIVEDEGKFIMNGGVIQGGMNGVVVEESASIDINNATFLNNHVSIQKKWQTDDAVQFDISDSRFAVTDGGLLPPLAGAINAQGIKAFSQNSPSVRLLGNNHFENFLLGVNAQQSNIAIQDGTTFFKDIRAAGVYAGADGKRTFTGEGMRFENVRTAVEVRNMNVVCTGSVMDNVAYGFRLYNGKERDFDITNNTINSRHFGVLMFNWKPGAKKDISNNTINILSGGSGTGVGIRLANMLDNSSFVNVIDNPITCGKGAQGIHLLDANSILMEGNTITRTGSAQVWDGILTDGGSSNMAICNGIGSTNPNGNSNAVLVDMSSSFTASCNSFNNTDTGLRFIGVNSPSIVEGNNFHALDIGVQVGEPLFSTNGFIGEQPHAGNQWPGQIGSDGLVYIGDIDEAQWSKFIINNGLMGTQFDPSADPPQFKDYDPNGSTFACSSCTPPPPVDGYFIQDHECDIANGSVVSAIFPAAQLWTAQRHLYRRLLKHQNLISNNDCTDAFFTNKTPTTIGKFEKIRKDINGLFELDNGDVQAMDGHRQSQNNLYDQLLMTYDQLTTASSADSILLANQKDNLLASLDSVATAIDVIDQAHQATWKANAQSIILDNAAIITSQVWEQNQQAYNQVWLEMTVNNQAFPDSVQLATLMGIANQCPYAGGEAVYQSRGLLSEDLVFDDVSLCNTGAQGYQKEDIQTALEFNVYPNPGKDHIVIELKDAANWGGNVTLTDMLGRFVRSQVIADGDQQAFLMLDAVPAGVYNLKVEVHGLTNVVKISVVK